jgi:iron complex transport system substrate-binding protein
MKRFKTVVAALLALAIALVSASCVQQPEAAAPMLMTDPSGQEFTVPSKIERIVSLAPAITDIVFALGEEGKVMAADTFSASVEGIDSAICVLEIYPPNAEAILAYEPDLVLVSGLSQVGDDDPYKALKEAGISVAYIPSSDSIEGIYGDIDFYGSLLGKDAEAQALIDGMKATIDRIAAIGSAITEKKTVLFEVSASPFIYSFGSDTFLNEMIEIIGAKNVLEVETGWLAVADETAVAANPDVILTNVNYIDDPVGEIMSRPAFAGVTAIINGDVHLIDSNYSSQPSHNIVKALEEMAKAIYPGSYGN